MKQTKKPKTEKLLGNEREGTLIAHFGATAEVIDALPRRFGGKLVVGVVDCDLALGLPRKRLDLSQFLLAAQSLDALVDDGFRIVRRANGLAERESQCRQKSRP